MRNAATRPVVPGTITFSNAPLGSRLASRGGFYATEDTTLSFQILGDTSSVFRLLTATSYDVIETNEGPHGTPVYSLQADQQVQGSGSIAVTAGQAVEVAVEFDCPTDPTSPAFRATAADPGGHEIPIRANANLGQLTGEILESPADLAPGETGVFSIRVHSTLGHAVQVRIVGDTATPGNFHVGSTNSQVISPAAFSDFSVSISCRLDTSIGNYQTVLDFEDTAGNQQGWMVVAFSVIGGSIQTSVETVSVVATKGGVTPVNLLLRSLRGGDTTVSFYLSGGTSDLTLTGPPIPIKAGQAVNGTVWLNAGISAPQNTTVQLVQLAFGGTQATTLPASIFVSAYPPPAQDRYVVLRIYWGTTWTAGNPFTWQDMEKGIFGLLRSAFVRGLAEYGVSEVTDVAMSRGPSPTQLPSVAVVDSFPGSNDFDHSDLTGLIAELIDSNKLAKPDQIDGIPIYMIMPQYKSIARFDPTIKNVGENFSFSYGGADWIYAWLYQASLVTGTTPPFSHELAEGITRNIAGMQIGDPCQNLFGVCDGIDVGGYLSKQRNLCVIPDMTSDSSVAATPPVAGITG